MSPLCLCREDWCCKTCCKCVNHCECALAGEPVHIKSKEFASARAKLLRARNQPVDAGPTEMSY